MSAAPAGNPRAWRYPGRRPDCLLFPSRCRPFDRPPVGCLRTRWLRHPDLARFHHLVSGSESLQAEHVVSVTKVFIVIFESCNQSGQCGRGAEITVGNVIHRYAPYTSLANSQFGHEASAIPSPRKRCVEKPYRRRSSLHYSVPATRRRSPLSGELPYPASLQSWQAPPRRRAANEQFKKSAGGSGAAGSSAV